MGFGVAVATGAAVFLGMSRVPLFSPLLDAIPEELRELLLPLSSFLMGLVALAVQFYAGERIVRSRLRRRFTAGLLLLLVGLVALLGFTLALVKEVPLPVVLEDGRPAVMVFIAGLWRKADCQCGSVSLESCMEGLAYDVSGCWSGASIVLAKLSLALSYLALIGGFGALVGLLLLQETARRQEAARKRNRSALRRPARKRKRTATDERSEPAEEPGEPTEDEGSERSISRTNSRSGE